MTKTIAVKSAHDPQMRSASARARASFRYFWRELAWERRRIVPALGFAAIHALLRDQSGPSQASTSASVPTSGQTEHLWLTEVDFDGQVLTGELLSQPQQLHSLRVGDVVQLPLNQLSDWMYVVDGEVYGGFTMNLLRSRMDQHERNEHDSAWGMDFGDPEQIRLVPRKPGWFSDSLPVEQQEHPLSLAMVPIFKEQVQEDPSLVHHCDERGWTLLHHLALAGSAANVRVLLQAGAAVNLQTDLGLTPMGLARVLGWEHVAGLLKRHGAVA